MSRRDKIRMSDPDLRAFVEASKTVILVSNGVGGFPHPMPMWFVMEPDGAIHMTTYGRSQKVLNLQRDPRVALLVEAGEEYAQLQGVVMRGKAEIIEDTERVIDTLIAAAGQRGNEDPAVRDGMRSNASKRVVIRVLPDEIFSWDHSKLGGVY